MSEEWYPIETAPTDGTSVLIFEDPTITSAHVYQETYEWVLDHDGGHDSLMPLVPTHWTPLPDPPRKDEQ